MSVSISDIEYIYRCFRKAQARHKNQGYRLPKDFEKHYNKMVEPNKKALWKITAWFLTKWQNIDPFEYFMCGFTLSNSFTYVKFFNEKILLLYITRDKLKKREGNTTKKGLVDSAKFVKSWMTENGATFYDYMRAREGNQLTAIDHYIDNKIDSAFFVFMLRKGMILTDQDRSLIPYIKTNFRKITFALNDISDFLIKLEEKLL